MVTCVPWYAGARASPTHHRERVARFVYCHIMYIAKRLHHVSNNGVFAMYIVKLFGGSDSKLLIKRNTQLCFTLVSSENFQNFSDNFHFDFP